jgi:hypothetical protein
VLVQSGPRPCEVIQIPPESKTGTGLFQRLRLRSRGSIIIVGPLFSRAECELKPKTVSSQVTSTFATIF